ncbi:hypothetical protein EVAR_25668_1 [Eumeta japonica]|uniref:Uncharacterized protein n=1 Tax=Eumeta variegata TaxID=151549 RepID=A0A4C1WH33_EUMVA|nr:hypothetical protein EVAR_25668_1 [Eumeta japonica]
MVIEYWESAPVVTSSHAHSVVSSFLRKRTQRHRNCNRERRTRLSLPTRTSRPTDSVIELHIYDRCLSFRVCRIRIFVYTRVKLQEAGSILNTRIKVCYSQDLPSASPVKRHLRFAIGTHRYESSSSIRV